MPIKHSKNALILKKYKFFWVIYIQNQSVSTTQNYIPLKTQIFRVWMLLNIKKHKFSAYRTVYFVQVVVFFGFFLIKDILNCFF